MSDKATNGTDRSAPGASPRAGTSTQARTGAYTFKRTISEFSEDNLYGLRRGADLLREPSARSNSTNAPIPRPRSGLGPRERGRQ
jgi:hypothetical protein